MLVIYFSNETSKYLIYSTDKFLIAIRLFVKIEFVKSCPEANILLMFFESHCKMIFGALISVPFPILPNATMILLPAYKLGSLTIAEHKFGYAKVSRFSPIISDKYF